MDERFGKYEIHRLIGCGGMAEVYEADAVGPGGFRKKVCLKKIRREYAEDIHFVKSFESEARIISRLRHPNIVEVFDFDRRNNTLYLAMEYVEGMDLSTLLNEVGRLGLQVPVEFAIYIMESLLSALSHAHFMKENDEIIPVIHRDISPHNILLSVEGAVKLTDFGIAKAKGLSNYTRTGVIKGKLAYMAPEQALVGEDPIGPPADIFASGVVFWEMLTNSRLFNSTLHHLSGDAPFIKEQSMPYLPSRLNDLLVRMAARKPADRFESGETALFALRELGLPPCSRFDAADLVRKILRNMERIKFYKERKEQELEEREEQERKEREEREREREEREREERERKEQENRAQGPKAGAGQGSSPSGAPQPFVDKQNASPARKNRIPPGRLASTRSCTSLLDPHRKRLSPPVIALILALCVAAVAGLTVITTLKIVHSPETETKTPSAAPVEPPTASAEKTQKKPPAEPEQNKTLARPEQTPDSPSASPEDQAGEKAPEQNAAARKQTSRKTPRWKKKKSERKTTAIKNRDTAKAPTAKAPVETASVDTQKAEDTTKSEKQNQTAPRNPAMLRPEEKAEVKKHMRKQGFFLEVDGFAEE